MEFPTSTAAAVAAAATAAAPAPAAEDLGQKIVRTILPHIEKHIEDLSTSGPELAWEVALDPSDEDAKEELAAVIARVSHYQQLRAKLLADPSFPPAFVAKYDVAQAA
jgi:hypothetical protein